MSDIDFNIKEMINAANNAGFSPYILAKKASLPPSIIYRWRDGINSPSWNNYLKFKKAYDALNLNNKRNSGDLNG